MFKRYTLEGGLADPLIISWPKAMKRVAGQVRDQYCHAIDLVPTILDCCGVEAPEVLKGYTQSPIQGTSLRYSFDDAKAPSQRETQYYAMLGTRAIYHQGWKAVARHGALLGKGKFMDDEWELYHVEEDRTETKNLAKEHPEKVQELVGIWFAAAGGNHVFPLDDRSARELLTLPRPETSKPRTSYDYYPGTADVPESVAPNIRNRSFTVLVEAEIDTPEAGGVLMAQGSRFGGYALFVKDGRLHFSDNFLGIEEQHVASTQAVPKGKVVLGAEFTKEKENPPAVANGTLKLYINDKAVGEMKMRTQPGKFALAGEGLCVGRDSADAVSKEYTAPNPFTGGTIKKVTINVGGDHYVDLELEALAMLSRE
jgi:arylsulfatase